MNNKHTPAEQSTAESSALFKQQLLTQFLICVPTNDNPPNQPVIHCTVNPSVTLMDPLSVKFWKVHACDMLCFDVLKAVVPLKRFKVD